MTERQLTSETKQQTSDPCCESTTLQTCCGTDAKPGCCGAETAPKVCGCSGTAQSRPDGRRGAS